MEKAVEIDSAYHALDVLARFNSFREGNKYCDFVIKSGKEVLPVHKCVVAASSEYFDAMLSHDTKENIEGVVEIKAHPKSIRKCVEFMYTGKAAVSDKMQEEFLHAAHMLRLHRLYNGIAMFLERNLNCESFFQTRITANRYDCSKLLEVCNEFALKNFEAIAEKDDFKTLEAEYLNFLMSSDYLKGSDEAKCKALMIWINNESHKAAALFNLIQGVNFRNVSLSYIMYILNNEKTVFTDAKCMKYVLNSVVDTPDTTPSDFSLCKRFGIILFDSSSNKLQRFSVNDKNWSEMQAFASDMSTHCSAVVLKDYIYAIIWDQSMHRIMYKDENATWEKMTSPSVRSGIDTTFEGSIYVSDGGTCNSGIERYNSIQNNWSLLPAKKFHLQRSCLATTAEALYVIGGHRSCGSAANDVEKYKPSTSEWEIVMSMNMSRYFASAASVDNKVFVFGGHKTSGQYESSMEIYEPNLKVWQLVGLANFNRSGFCSWAYGEKIYIVGGNQSGTKTIDEFDPKTKCLTRVTEFGGKTINYYSSVAVFM